jgi:hypothetical protein
MTSFGQTEANRRNARKSTGPNTPEGKQRSRCNALRHGLTAETAIVALEDAEDFEQHRAFQIKLAARFQRSDIASPAQPDREDHAGRELHRQ